MCIHSIDFDLFEIRYSSLGVYNLIDENVLRQLRVVLEESSEQANRVRDIVGTTGLTATVHTQLGVTKIQCTGTEGCRQHRTDGATAARVVANDKQLQRDVLANLLGVFASNLLQ